jgi:hypothetical protein
MLRVVAQGGRLDPPAPLLLLPQIGLFGIEEILCHSRKFKNGKLLAHEPDISSLYYYCPQNGLFGAKIPERFSSGGRRRTHPQARERLRGF